MIIKNIWNIGKKKSARAGNRLTITLSVILLPAHPASFAHKFLFQRVPASPGMQQYCRLVIKKSVLDS